jgi:lysylphosphatidylglycerol synthetase-like protein (DUF2156 family)
MANLVDIMLGLRILSILFAICELGLNAYIVQHADHYFYEDPYGDWGVNHDTPSQIAFLLFASAWSLLALICLILAPIYLVTGGQDASQTSRNAKYLYGILALDTVTTIFWLAGWIALAELIGGPTTCTDFCAAIQASVGFAAALWATFMVCGFLGIWQMWKRRQSIAQNKANPEGTGRSWYGMS